MKHQIKFKQTEIGKIPDDWEVKCLSQLGKIITGKTPKTKNKDNFGHDYPFITPRDMKGQKHIYETERYLSEKGRNSVKNCLIPKGSVCVSCIGSDMGKIIKTKEEGVTNQQINSIIPNISSDFLYYALLNISQNIKNLGKQSTAVPILNKSQFSGIEIAMPTKIREMEEIAEILSDLDEKIELNNKINKNLEAIGQVLFKHWFNDLKEIPNKWETKPLDEIADFLNGLALQKYPAIEGEEFLSVIKIRELRNGITEQTDKANLETPKEYIIENGDVLFSWSGSLEVVVWTSGRGALNQHLFKVTSKEYPKWFYYFWTKSFLPEFRRIAEGKATTMGHIQRHNLSESEVLVPDRNELDKMSKIMTPLMEKIIALNLESQNLSKIRDFLLPKLMSGEIRVV